MGSCAAPSAKGDDKFITTDYLQQCPRGLYASGAVSYIEVLDAERSLFATQQTILDLTYSRQVNEINLFTALGGGWVE
ncbi:hypothetical protein VAJ61_27325 [Klebsiella pneumoniae]